MVWIQKSVLVVSTACLSMLFTRIGLAWTAYVAVVSNAMRRHIRLIASKYSQRKKPDTNRTQNLQSSVMTGESVVLAVNKQKKPLVHFLTGANHLRMGFTMNAARVGLKFANSDGPNQRIAGSELNMTQAILGARDVSASEKKWWPPMVVDARAVGKRASRFLLLTISAAGITTIIRGVSREAGPASIPNSNRWAGLRIVIGYSV